MAVVVYHRSIEVIEEEGQKDVCQGEKHDQAMALSEQQFNAFLQPPNSL
jgi:hypothetical protein